MFETILFSLLLGLPNELPADRSTAQSAATNGDLRSLPVDRPEIMPVEERASRDFCWGSLVASTVHPVKVAIVEALLWVNEPLSATELVEIFGSGDLDLDMVLYHLRGLTRLEVIEVTNIRRARGAREKYVFFR